MTKPYPFGTKVQLKAGGRHEILEAYLRDNDRVEGGGYRYQAVFPYAQTCREAKVYSEEIERATGFLSEAEMWALLRALEVV